MADRQKSAERQLASARATLESTLGRFEEALKAHNERQRIAAPVAGTVSNVAVTGDGELVTSGQELLQLIPEGGELVAELDIANKDIGELSPGMPVKLKLDAFPFQEYGVVSGVLREVPPDVRVEDGRQGSPTYKVVASLDTTTLDDRGARKPILLGMSLSADVQTRQRSLLQLALLEVLKLRSYFE
jgi:multidrug efflux pump subunit AcrA (membrane-fusion protein)